MSSGHPALEPRSVRTVRLICLSNAAVSVPLLMYGADRADYFAEYSCDRIDLVVILLAIAYGPGLALSALETISPARVRPFVHRAAVAILLWAACLQFMNFGAGVTFVAGAVCAAGLAAGLWRLVFRPPADRRLGLALLLACLVVPSYIVSSSSVAMLAVSTNVPLADAPVSRPAPVFFIIFDGTPLFPLLAPDHSFDETLCPNLARLGKVATFYRNATCNYSYTNLSMPSLLSGCLPGLRAQMVAAHHPRTLFGLLAKSYHIYADELGSRLVPENAPSVVRLAPSHADRLAAIATDLVTVVPLIVWGGLSERSQADLVQKLQFCGRERARLADDAYERSDRFRRFVSGIRKGDRRTLYYAAFGLPHDPWTYLPSGDRYTVPAESQGIRLSMISTDHLYFFWTKDEWTVRQSYQRYLLQLMFTDRLVGELLDRIEAEGLLDESLIVVGTDHGSSVIPGNLPRDLVMLDADQERRKQIVSNWREIVYVPLWIKLPGQKQGAVSDRNVELIDILPTIAEALGVRIPWKVDGTSLVDPRVPERETKTFVNYDLTRFSLPKASPERFQPLSKRQWFAPAPGNQWVYRVLPLGDWVGRDLSKASYETLGDLEVSFEGPDRNPPGVIKGTVRTARLAKGPLYVLVLDHGTVVAATRTQELEPGRASFLAFEPAGGRPRGDPAREVRLVAIDRSGARLYGRGR